jgi:hypothetical protein
MMSFAAMNNKGKKNQKHVFDKNRTNWGSFQTKSIPQPVDEPGHVASSVSQSTTIPGVAAAAAATTIATAHLAMHHQSPAAGECLCVFLTVMLYTAATYPGGAFV